VRQREIAKGKKTEGIGLESAIDADMRGKLLLICLRALEYILRRRATVAPGLDPAFVGAVAPADEAVAVIVVWASHGLYSLTLDLVCLGASGHKRFYEKVIKVKADVAALLNLFSDVSIDVRG
jgi:hypothetical protein